MGLTCAIDVGNSALKWAILDDLCVQAAGAVVHREVGLAAALASVPAAVRSAPRLAVVNVAGAAAAVSLADWREAATYWVTPQAEACGVRNGYLEPARLGADRWAALVAAQRDAHAGTIIVGCGTAITLDVLRADGTHLGGHILPGLHVTRHALAIGTAAVQVGAADDGARGLGRDPATGVDTGLRRAVAAMTESVLSEVAGTESAAWRVLLTGGDAERFRPWFPGPVSVEPHLVLLGAAMLMDHAVP